MLDLPKSVLDRDISLELPDAIALTSADTGPEGVRAVIVHGECYGRRIEWEPTGEPKTGLS